MPCAVSSRKPSDPGAGRIASTRTPVRTGAAAAAQYRSMNATTSSRVEKPSGCGPSYGCPGSARLQLGNWKWSESHRSLRQRSATRPRSSTTWARPRRLSWWLIASPAWPPPTITVSCRASMVRQGYGGAGG